MVATRDFAGLVSSACALANAAARQAMDSLDRCMAGLLDEEVETHGAGFRALGADPMADRLLGILWHKALEFGLGMLVFEMSRPSLCKDASEFRPGVGAAHVDNPDCLDAWPWRLDPE